MAKERDEQADFEKEPQGLPTWKKLLLALAGVFLIVGLALRFSGDAGAEPADGSSGGEYGTSFLPGSEGAGDGEVASGGAASWSPFFLQGGFGFFLGFSIASVLRMFFKVFVFGAGVLFLLLIGLQYAGVDIPWDSLRETYDNLAGRVVQNADGIKAFFQGAIPATAFSGAGFVAGWKRD